ncbi:MAG: hypothetical protein KGI78_04345 [Patescibacteria group bacterium]|nr:hypothetical protein [Patescibacteria group bacterium]MDE1944503.1 hypothetical protein [Patescibacteria group bacterium]MDE1945113.1 hypothetical protein [Patescibacteria group bacterium]MDE2058043.1 hypothetical protein [Patescibacteria group bacterium]
MTPTPLVVLLIVGFAPEELTVRPVVKAFAPEKVLASPSRVEEAAVMLWESPRLKSVPLTVMLECWRALFGRSREEEAML